MGKDEAARDVCGMSRAITQPGSALYLRRDEHVRDEHGIVHGVWRVSELFQNQAWDWCQDFETTCGLVDTYMVELQQENKTEQPVTCVECLAS